MLKKSRVKRHLVTQPSDPSYRLIPLTRNQNTLVDATDYDWLNKSTWTAMLVKNHGFYAVRGATKDHPYETMQAVILGCKKGEEGDHINHDTLDNRRANLRKCTHAQNLQNGKMFKSNKSGYRGVSWDECCKK